MALDSDRNLLFGFLALQNDFISREDLVAAVGLWLTDKSKPLDQIFLDRGLLPENQRALLSALVQAHVEKHDGDPQQSLAALDTVATSVRAKLTQLGDEDVEQTMTFVSSQGLTANTTVNDEWLSEPRDSESRFRVLRSHAAGGLGEVFVAEDQELHREVALKEIQREQADIPDNRSRFLLEAEITGGLEHPGIVPVYGLGQYADGRPYYAMRFIRGQSLKVAIDQFHRSSKPSQESRSDADKTNDIELARRPVVDKSGDTLPQADEPTLAEGKPLLGDTVGETHPKFETVAFRNLLGRFVDVCNAIEYAHSRGVLHRDLKPSNIMLGRYGETLVVDWGLAKVAGRDEVSRVDGETTLQPLSTSGSMPTQMGSAIGTPAYMSPEQASGRLAELGRESDVYSLGATLFYLLAGRAPFTDRSVDEVLSKVRAGDFPRPQSIVPDVPAPLEAICLKCMETDRQNRYPSPRDLADDIDRFLADEPVTAYREPTSVRTRRWFRKHPKSVAALATSILVGLVGAILIAVVVFGKNQELAKANTDLATSVSAERKAKTQAAAQRDRARAAERQAKESAAEARKQELAARRSAEEAQTVMSFLKNEVLAAARPKGQAGGIGVDATVRQVIDVAEPKIAKLFKEQPLVEASLRDTLGTTYWYLGVHVASVKQHQRAYELRKSELGPKHANTVSSMSSLTLAYRSAGQLNQALALAKEVLELRQAEFGLEHEKTIHAMNNLAIAYNSLRRWDKALPLLEKIVELCRKKLGDNHADTMLFINNLAFSYNSAGMPEKAVPLAEESLKRRTETLGAEHADTLASMNSLTMAYKATDQLDKALPLAIKTVELCKTKFGAKHPKTLVTMLTLANVYKAADNLDKAFPLYEDALKLYRETLGPKHPFSLSALRSLATAYKSAGKTKQAIPLFEETLKLRRVLLGEKHLDTAATMNELSNAYANVDEWEKALPIAQQALEIRREELGDQDKYTIQSINNLAIVYKVAEKYNKAIPLYEESFKLYRQTLGADHAYTLTATKSLAGAYLAAKQPEKALPGYEAYVAAYRSKSKLDDPRFAARLASIGRDLVKHHQYSVAEPYLRESMSIREKVLADDWRLFNVKSLLGEALLGQAHDVLPTNEEVARKRYTEAESLLIAGYEGMKSREATMSDTAKTRLADAAKRLFQLYTALENPQEAAKWKALLPNDSTK